VIGTFRVEDAGILGPSSKHSQRLAVCSTKDPCGRRGRVGDLQVVAGPWH
jgi:hypothetical protein